MEPIGGIKSTYHRSPSPVVFTIDCSKAVVLVVLFKSGGSCGALSLLLLAVERLNWHCNHPFGEEGVIHDFFCYVTCIQSVILCCFSS